MGHATGNTGGFFTVDPLAFTATAATNVGRVRVGNTNALTVPAGTTAVAAGLYVDEPNLTATGTITTACTVYITAAPTEGGTNNYALYVDAGDVQFDGALTVGGAFTATSGTITGITDLVVADGGTGVSTLTDGGVLLGSGTGAITPMAVLADSEFIVGNGTTDPVAESGNTARTSMGIANHDNISVTSAGEATNTAQPAFLVVNSANDDNVTGDGTVATVDFDSEIFDQGADFATDTFTAPVTGRYLLEANVRLDGVTAAGDNLDIILVTSNRSFSYNRVNTDSLPSTESLSISVVADMDASDTVTVTVQVTGEATDVVDIVGGAAPETFFSGCLLA